MCSWSTYESHRYQKQSAIYRLPPRVFHLPLNFLYTCTSNGSKCSIAMLIQDAPTCHWRSTVGKDCSCLLITSTQQSGVSHLGWKVSLHVDLICTFIKSLFLLYENIVRLNCFLAALMSLSSYKGEQLHWCEFLYGVCICNESSTLYQYVYIIERLMGAYNL